MLTRRRRTTTTVTAGTVDGNGAFDGAAYLADGIEEALERSPPSKSIRPSATGEAKSHCMIYHCTVSNSPSDVGDAIGPLQSSIIEVRISFGRGYRRGESSLPTEENMRKEPLPFSSTVAWFVAGMGAASSKWKSLSHLPLHPQTEKS
ncbi:hypothetical protein COCNU_07G005930 [Cocos nucifera]|uniref:Uncharacterized protein n=1 Tax=Cocos nucifera TaxID=13894 RepID=A0A8K0IEB7_COCNU|nr:hypothetical protein COCNU_07G005930 [Cocos nucifera]